MTHTLAHDARPDGRLHHPERRFDRRRRDVADWGADDVFHAPDRHGGREARSATRFADRWNAQHATGPIATDPLDDWIPGGATAAGSVREWDGDPRADSDAALADARRRDPRSASRAAGAIGTGAPWAGEPQDHSGSDHDTAELDADWDGDAPAAGPGPARAPRVSARDAALLDEWDPRPAPGPRVAADWLDGGDEQVAVALDAGAPDGRRKRRPAEDWMAGVPPKRASEAVTVREQDQFASNGEPPLDDDPALVPAQRFAENGRRTVVVRGRPDAIAASRPVVPAARRSDLGFEQRWAARPDRIAAWAAFLGFLLILVAVTTAQAATLAG